MDIIHTLEDIDSRLEKARGSVGRWFAVAGIVAVGAVLASWGIRSYLSARSASKWASFDMHLAVGGGLFSSPRVMARTDVDAAAAEVRASTKESWGDIARIIVSSTQNDFDRAMESLSVVRANANKDRAAASVFALPTTQDAGGLDALAKRLEGMRAWSASRPALRGNLPRDDAPGFEFSLGERDLVFRCDPKLPVSFADDLRGMAQTGAFSNAKLVWSASERTYDLALGPDKAEHQEKLDSILEKLGFDDPSFSLFKGTLAVKAIPPKETGDSPRRTLALLGSDSLGREFDWIPVATLAKGSEVLPVNPSASPEKTELVILGAK
ncbi:MAG TPA: hypothetical protein VFI25_14760 [Planctomycetota bacterium]|jgi:hypothetical protein|nr:hypothetical protein [Planctomycetota bacterium]